MRQLGQVGMHQRGDFISVWTDPYPTEPMVNRLPLNTTGVSVNWHDRGVETVNDYARQSWLRWRPPDVFITMYGLWLFDCAFQDIVCFRDEIVSCFLSQPSPVFLFCKRSVRFNSVLTFHTKRRMACFITHWYTHVRDVCGDISDCPLWVNTDGFIVLILYLRKWPSNWHLIDLLRIKCHILKTICSHYYI